MDQNLLLTLGYENGEHPAELEDRLVRLTDAAVALLDAGRTDERRTQALGLRDLAVWVDGLGRVVAELEDDLAEGSFPTLPHPKDLRARLNETIAAMFEAKIAAGMVVGDPTSEAARYGTVGAVGAYLVLALEAIPADAGADRQRLALHDLAFLLLGTLRVAEGLMDQATPGAARAVRMPDHETLVDQVVGAAAAVREEARAEAEELGYREEAA